MTTKRCPECESDDLLVRAVTSYNFNTGEFYCHSVKTHDSDAEVQCQDCDWKGCVGEFEEDEE